MEFFHFNTEVSNVVYKLFKVNFYNQIKNTGIVFQEIFETTNLVTKATFYILVCDDQEQVQYIRFKDAQGLFLRLTAIAHKRLDKLKKEEMELMKINDTEAYGENRYFNDKEMNAICKSSILDLLKHFEMNQKHKLNK